MSTPIQIKLEGEKQLADLGDFANVCSALRNCINQVGRCLGEDAESVISGLSIGSAILEVTPIAEVVFQVYSCEQLLP